MAESLIDLVARAQALSDAGNRASAIAAYREWLAENDASLGYAAQFNLAILYLQTHDIGLAQAALRRCLAQNPTFEPALRICIEPNLDSHRPMAARASFGHGKLRIGWIAHDSELNIRLDESLRSDSIDARVCDHLLFSWGAGITPKAIDLGGIPDNQAACLIRDREIDVLIDLDGWAAGGRPGILAYHPASMQMSWPRVPQSSGLAAMDYVIAGVNDISPEQASVLTETLLAHELALINSQISDEETLTQIESLLIEEHTKLPLRVPWPSSSVEDLVYLQAPESNGRRYVIVAPPYQHNSAGIRVLYDLQKWLVRAGYDAMICTWFQGYPIDAFADDIVVYPEVAPGNILQAKRIVRFIMNTPGKLGYGEKTYAPNELLVAYNPQLAPYSDGLVLQVPSTEGFFHPNSVLPRDKDAFYVGKGQNLQAHPAHCVEITKTFPATRTALGELLRSVHTLYTYDNFTMLVWEARLCGCEYVYINGQGLQEPLTEAHMPTIVEFRAQLHRFIAITQSL
jgi:tetratricopeptide (TPR) repeat protein